MFKRKYPDYRNAQNTMSKIHQCILMLIFIVRLHGVLKKYFFCGKKTFKFNFILQLSWLDGQSLAQSLFTCLYLHNPSEIQNKCLQTWSYAMLKLCRLVKDIIIMVSAR